MGLKTNLTSLVLLIGLLSVSANGQPVTETTTNYAIDSENSILRVYVGRAGLLARMGHNHVMYTREISGQILLAPNLENSSASFSFPVSSLVVDEQSERERAGDGFQSRPSESAIQGTRENMMGEDVLNADAFPAIAATMKVLSVSGDQWLFLVELDFQGSVFSQEIPAQVELSGTELSVNASFTIEHGDIGLSPFTAVGGMLRVAEAMDFELQIVATAQ